MIFMSMSAQIAKIIMEMLESSGETEIQRNELAQTLGCVPSQINYVLSSRFTPEHGYIVESHRGGGGYIRITRVKMDRGTIFMHLINSIGDSMGEKTCQAHIINLNGRGVIDENTAKLMIAATSENSLRILEPNLRARARASLFKHMLLALTR